MIGQTISHYRVVGQLGSGGMGVVYRAEDVRLGRSVALKFVSEDFAHDPQAVQRLRDEARAASSLITPNARDSMNSLSGAAGLKVSPLDRLLIDFNVLFKLDEHGLRDKVTPLIGFEYAF